MKKLALTSLMVMSFVATSYAAMDSDVVGVTDTHVRTKHMKNGSHKSEVVAAKHTGDAASAETATLFFSGIGKFLDQGKDALKALGKDAIGSINAKVNKNATPAEVSAAADASSPMD